MFLLLADIFSYLPQYDVLPNSEEENTPVIMFDFTKDSLNISNNPEHLDCFLNLPLLNIAVNSPIDFSWINRNKTTGNKLVTKAEKFPNFSVLKINFWIPNSVYQMNFASHNGILILPKNRSHH